MGDNNTFGHVDREVLDRVLVKTTGENGGRVFMTEAGAGVTSANDVCYSLNEGSDDRRPRHCSSGALRWWTVNSRPAPRATRRVTQTSWSS